MQAPDVLPVIQLPRPQRRYFLSQLHPAWADSMTCGTCYLLFDCPEGHTDCDITIPFTPNLDGAHVSLAPPIWTRQVGVRIDFATLTLTPAIKRIPQYTSFEAAKLQRPGLVYLHPSLLCGFHGSIVDGRILFHEDSR